MSNRAILVPDFSSNTVLFNEKQTLERFQKKLVQLKEEVNRLSFMMSEIRVVIDTASSAKNLELGL